MRRFRRYHAVRKFIASGLALVLSSSSALTPLAQAHPFSTYSKGPGEELGNKEENGFFNPLLLQQRLAGQQSVVLEMKRREERQEFIKRKNVMNVLKNVQDILRSKYATQEEFESEMERRRKASAAVFGEGGLFTFVKYGDGKKVWFKGGQVAKVENERVTDAHGNVSLKNMDEMEYDAKGLLTSYRSDITDENGNKKSIYWHGGTYTDDSVAYGGEGTHYKKLLTGYIQETTDDHGNTTIVDWKDGAYNNKDELTSYNEVLTDNNGNISQKSWRNGQYDENGQLTNFDETTVDSLGLKTEQHFSGGVYEKNGAYVDGEKTPGIPEYFLVQYHEDVTDSKGQLTNTDWDHGVYNTSGDLLSYHQTSRKTVDGQNQTQEIAWSNGIYDSLGRLNSYDEKITGYDGQSEFHQWRNGQYNLAGQLLHNDETVTDSEGNKTSHSFTADQDHGYNAKGQLNSYEEESVDARGNSSRKDWIAGSYDSHGRVLSYTETDIDPNGNSNAHTWSTDDTGYDKFGQILHYSDSSVDDRGNTNSKTWGGAVYDGEGHLQRYDESDTDARGGISLRTWEEGQYDDLGRVTSYLETRTDADGNVEKTKWSSGSYDEKGHLLGYVEAFTNLYGETQIKNWSALSGDYDAFGDLLGYIETIHYEDGTLTSLERTGSTYNQMGQLTHYEESSTTVMPGHSMPADLDMNLGVTDQEKALVEGSQTASEQKTWDGGLYNTRGELTSYHEAVTDQNGLTQIHAWQGAYDGAGDVNKTHDVLTYADGLTTTTDWNGSDFDGRGRATTSRQIQYFSDEPLLAHITQNSELTFDRQGQRTGGFESTLTAGTGKDGKSVYLSQNSQISGAVLSNGVLTGYQEKTLTSGTDTDLTWIQYRVDKEVSNLSRSGYVEKTTTYNSATPVDASDGHSVTVTRSAMVRDYEGRVIAYTDSVLDEAAGPNLAVTQRLNTQYDGFNGMASSVDLVVNTKGEKDIEVTAGIKQDDRGNMISFDKTTKQFKTGAQSLPENWSQMSTEDQNSFIDSLRSKLSPNTSIQVDATHGEVSLSLYSVGENRRLNTSYDSLGRQVSYQEEQHSTEVKGTSLVSWTAKEFNEANQVSSEVTTTETYDGDSVSAIPSRTVESYKNLMTYNRLGQLGGYRERSTDSQKPDEILSHDISGMTYDIYGALATSIDKTVTGDVDELTHNVTWGGLTTESVRGDAQFDALGRLVGYVDSVHEHGQSEDGGVLDHLQKIVRKTRYDDTHLNRVLGYTEESTDSSSPALLTITTRENHEFGLNDQVTGYKETVQTKGEITGDVKNADGTTSLQTLPIDHTETTQRSGMIFSEKGDLTSYFETHTASDQPGQVQQTAWSAQYDEKDRVIHSHQDTTVLMNGQKQGIQSSDRSGMAYDGKNHLMDYTDLTSKQVVLPDGTLSTAISNTTIRDHTTYNRLSQVTGYHETQTNSETSEKKDILNERASYDVSGRLKGFLETTQLSSTATDGSSYSVTQIDKRVNTLYNALGQVSGYLEDQSASDKPDLVVTETVSGSVYDKEGRMVNSIKNDHHQSLTPGQLDYYVESVTSGFTFNQLGQLVDKDENVRTFNGLIDETESIHTRGTAYNAWGEVTGYDQESTTSQAPDKLTKLSYQVTGVDEFGRARATVQSTNTNGYLTESRRNNINLDSLGRIVGYTESDKNSASDRMSLTDWVGTYDDAGRLMTYSETGSNDQSDVVTLNNRVSTTYDRLGAVQSYEENSRSSSSPDLITMNSYKATGTNTAGLNTGYIDLQKTIGSSSEIVDSHTRSGITYLKNGLLNTYFDVGNSSLSPNLTNFVNRQHTSYDSMGRENTYGETVNTVSGDGSLNVTSRTERSGSVYNNQNQLTGKSEAVWSDAAPGVISSNNWAGAYGANGLLVSSHETDHQVGLSKNGDVLDKTIVQDTLARNWDRQDRLINETTRSNNGEGETETHVWIAGGFDQDGRATTDLVDATVEGNGLHVQTTTARDQMTYDSEGRLSGYDLLQTSSANPDQQTSQHVAQTLYNENGQKMSEGGEKAVTDISTGGQRLSQNQSYFNTQEFDSKGRLAGYSNVITDHTLGVVTTDKKSNTTYSDLGIESGSAEEIQKSSLTPGLLNTSERSTHQVLRVNSLGQTFETQDSHWSSVAPDKLDVTHQVGVSYNGTGQVDSYHQMTVSSSISEPGHYQVVNEDNRASTSYDANGREIKANGVQWSSTAPAVLNAISDDFTYNDLGQNSSQARTSHETTADGAFDLTTMNKSELEYNSKGLVSHELNTGHSSQAPGLTTLNDITTIYGDAGLAQKISTDSLVQGHEAPLDSAEAATYLASSAFQTLTEDQKTTLKNDLENGIDINLKTHTDRAGTVYDTEGRLSGYTDTTNSPDAPGIITTAVKDHTVFNNLGQEVSSHEKTVKQSFTDGTSCKTVSDLSRANEAYDSVGRLSTYTNTTNDGSALTIVTNRNQTTYNDRGFVESKSERTHTSGVDSETGKAIDITAVSVQDQTTYDAQGRANHYRETTDSSATGESVHFWSASSFDNSGQAVSVNESGHSTGEGNWTRATETLLTGSAGQVILATTQGTSSTSGDYQFATTHIDETGREGYNALGQSTYEEESGFRHGTGNFTQVLNTGFSDSYDSLGRQNRAVNTLTQSINGVLKTTIDDISSQTYDAFNQLVNKNYSEIINDGGDSQKNSFNTWTGSYDSQGRADGYNTDGITKILDKSGELVFSETTDSGRKDITYGVDGDVTGYRDFSDLTTVNAEGDVVQESHNAGLMQNIIHNLDGQVTHSESSGTKDGKAYTENYDAKAFNSSGEATQWTRNGTNADGGPTHSTQDDGKFDDMGRLISFSQHGIAGGEVFKKDVQNARYDANGQMVSQDESGETDAGLYSNHQVNSYDLLGRLSGHEETKGIDSQGEYSLKNNNYKYDKEGKLVSKDYIRTDSFGQVTAGTWTGQYSNDGNLASTHDVGSMTDANGKLVSIVTDWKAVNYDKGLLTAGVTTTQTTKDGAVETVVQNKTNTVGEDGSFHSTKDDTTQTVVSSDGQITITETTDEKHAITRYTKEDEDQDSSHRAGRISGYEETTQKDKELPTYNLAQNITYGSDGNEIDSNKATFQSGLITSVSDKLDFVGAQVFAFLRSAFSSLATLVKSGFNTLLNGKSSPVTGPLEINLPTASQVLSPTDYTVDFVHRTNGIKDSHGRVTSWVETVRSSAAPAKTTTSIVTVTYKGATSELDTYDATTTEKTAEAVKTTTIKLHDYEYIDGRLYGTHGEVTEKSVDQASGETTLNHTYDYDEYVKTVDGQGRALVTERTTTKDSAAPALTKKDTTTVSYDSAGRIQTKHTESSELGTDKAPLDSWTEMDDTYEYNNNNQVKKTTRTTKTSQDPDGLTTTITGSQDFDDEGRAKTVTTDITVVSNGVTTHDQTVDHINTFTADGQPADYTRTTISTKGSLQTKTVDALKSTYDLNGHLLTTAGNETKTETEFDSSGAELNHVVTTGKVSNQNATYNELGQAVKIIHGGGTQTSISYSPDGTETGRLIKDPGTTTETLTYDKSGKVHSDLQVTTYGGTNEFSKVENNQTFEYDAKGHLINTHSDIKTTSQGGYVHSYSKDTAGTDRDSSGNFTNYTETISKDSVSPDLSISNAYTNCTYDARGNLKDYDLDSTSTGKNADGTDYKNPDVGHHHEDFNALGEVVGTGDRSQTVIDNVQKAVNQLQNDIASQTQDKPDFTGQLKTVDDNLGVKLDGIKTDEDAALKPYEDKLKALLQEEKDWGQILVMAQVAGLWKSFSGNWWTENNRQLNQEANNLNYSNPDENQFNKVRQDIAHAFYDSMTDLEKNSALEANVTRDTMANFLISWEKNSASNQSSNNFSQVFSQMDFQKQPSYYSNTPIDKSQTVASPAAERFDGLWQVAKNEISARVNWYHNNNLSFEEQIHEVYDGNYNWWKKSIKDQIIDDRKAANDAEDPIKKDFQTKIDLATDDAHSQSKYITQQEDVWNAEMAAKKDDLTYQTNIQKNYSDNKMTSGTKDIVYDNYGHIQGQKEWDAATGLWNVDNNYHYDGQNNLTGFDRNYTGSSTNKIDTISMTYKWDGELDATTVSTDEKINGADHVTINSSSVKERDRNGRVTKEDRTSWDSYSKDKKDAYTATMSYDDKNQLKSSTTDHWEVVNEVWTHQDQETITPTTYDSLGRVQTYTKVSQKNSDGDVTATATGHYIYGENGQAVGTDENVDYKGQALKTSAHEVTLTTKYDNGRATDMLRFVDKNTAQPGQSILDNIHINYTDGLNNTSITNRSIAGHEMAPRTMTLTDTNTFDTLGRLSSKTSVTTNDNYYDDSKSVTENLSKITYDAYGRQTGYHDEATDSYTEDGEKKSNTTITDRSGMTYNGDGQLDTFREVSNGVERNVEGSRYYSNGWLHDQKENRVWSGTINNQIQGLSGDWSAGNIQMTQSYTYDEWGRVASYSVDAKGRATNDQFKNVALAGTGASRSLGAMGDFQFSYKKSNIQYNGKGWILKSHETSTQYGLTQENYLRSHRGWSGARRSATRTVVGLITNSTDSNVLEFNSFGQASKSYSTFSDSTGAYGWTKQENMKYDNQGRLISATTESWQHISGKNGSQSYTAELHSKKDQTFSYDTKGKSKATDVYVDFDTQDVHMHESGNFFSTDIGKFTKIVIELVVAAIVTYYTGSTKLGEMAGEGTGMSIDVFVAEQQGQPTSSKYWKMIGAQVGVEILFMCVFGGQDPKIGDGAKEGGKTVAGDTAKNAIDEEAKNEVKKQIEKQIQDQLKDRIVHAVLILAPIQFVEMKVGQRIAEKSGQKTAAFWSTVMASLSIPMAGQPTSVFNQSFISGVSKGMFLVGLMSVEDHNKNQENKGKMNSFLFQFFQAAESHLATAFSSGFMESLQSIHGAIPTSVNSGITKDSLESKISELSKGFFTLLFSGNHGAFDGNVGTPKKNGFIDKGYGVIRGTVEILSDVIRSTWEFAAGGVVAIGQFIAPALPFIPAVVAMLGPVGAVVAMALLSGNYIAAFMAPNFHTGLDRFIKTTPKKLSNIWKAFAVNLSDDVGAFGQHDVKITIRQSLLNLVGMIPIFGNLIAGPRVAFDSVAGGVHSRGIHGNDSIETKRNGQDLADQLTILTGKKFINSEYEYGTFTDVAMGILNIEHSMSYDEAWQFLRSGINQQDMGYLLTGHSGGVQRSGYFSKILGNLGYGVAILIGVAGPLGGLVPTNFGNVGEIHLLGSSHEDFVSRMADIMSGTPRDIYGNKPDRNFNFKNSDGINYSHNNIGYDSNNPNVNPYYTNIESIIKYYMHEHRMEFSDR